MAGASLRVTLAADRPQDALMATLDAGSGGTISRSSDYIGFVFLDEDDNDIAYYPFSDTTARVQTDGLRGNGRRTQRVNIPNDDIPSNVASVAGLCGRTGNTWATVLAGTVGGGFRSPAVDLPNGYMPGGASTAPATPADTDPPEHEGTVFSDDLSTITLTYNEDLDTGSVPPAGAFVASGGLRIAGVSIVGRTVVLRVTGARNSTTYAIGYSTTRTGGNPIQDDAGNEVDSTTYRVMSPAAAPDPDPDPDPDPAPDPVAVTPVTSTRRRPPLSLQNIERDMLFVNPDAGTTASDLTPVVADLSQVTAASWNVKTSGMLDPQVGRFNSGFSLAITAGRVLAVGAGVLVENNAKENIFRVRAGGIATGGLLLIPFVGELDAAADNAEQVEVRPFGASADLLGFSEAVSVRPSGLHGYLFGIAAFNPTAASVTSFVRVNGSIQRMAVNPPRMIAALR